MVDRILSLKGVPILDPLCLIVGTICELLMVQSDVKRLGICGYAIHYKHYYGNKLFD